MVEIIKQSERVEEQEIINETRENLNKLRNDIKWNSEKKETSKNPEITKREWRLVYCRVLKWDSIPKIRERLSKYPEFSYLKESTYGWNGRNEKWFNINPKSLRAGMDLMVPIKMEDRQIEDKVFLENCKTAINNMTSNSTYWKRIKTLVEKIWVNNLSRVMSAFARVETANWDKRTKIWTWWLYRYENTSTYSISYYHILAKSEYAWEKALKNLGMNVWDTCDPVKAWMLFLWFWCECENYAKQKYKLTLEQCLNPNNKYRYSNASKIYNNGSSSYPSLLKGSY